MHAELEKYKLLVDFLGETLGEDTEVVLHDLTHLEASIVAIKNGHISGRKVGDAVTNFVLQSLKDLEEVKIQQVCNYKGYAKNGNLLNSSSLYLFDEKDKLIGMLCINKNCAPIMGMIETLQQMIGFKNVEAVHELKEVFTTTPEELTKENLTKISLEMGISPERMTQDEKIRVVRRLQSMGTFFLKGAVYDVAQFMNCSEATVYRYLSLIKKETSKQ